MPSQLWTGPVKVSIQTPCRAEVVTSCRAPAGVSVRRVGLEAADDRPGRGGGPRIGDGGQVPSSAVSTGQVGRAHQPCDTAASACGAVTLENGMDAWAP
jgi:hypothetical protein